MIHKYINITDMKRFIPRLVEEVKQKCSGVQLQTEDVYMATTFQDFIQMFVRKLRGEDQEEELVIDYVSQVLSRLTFYLQIKICRCLWLVNL